MKLKYIIRPSTVGIIPYVTEVIEVGNENNWELTPSFTKWGARRKIKGLAKKLIEKNKDKTIESGFVKCVEGVEQ